METRAELVDGVDTLTLLGLLGKAAAHKGLRIQAGSSSAYSEPIKEYVLDEELLAALAESGIKRQERPDCRNEIFTLVDENPQNKVPGWSSSNYWNFKLFEGDERKFDLRVTLYVGFQVSFKKRGVVLMPLARGSFFSPADHLPNLRMFEVLVNENDGDLPVVAKELVESGGTIVVTWTELGLGDIHKLPDLFEEFVGGNDLVNQLGRTGSVFDPAPYPHRQQPRDELFVLEQTQPKIFQMWRAQLNEYRDRLIV
ncbi:MAG: hypothetical protein HY452_02805 [Parcubacteria group bacterium]|nr:hypothetical protein [Parcubacteria group bacterium]